MLPAQVLPAHSFRLRALVVAATAVTLSAGAGLVVSDSHAAAPARAAERAGAQLPITTLEAEGAATDGAVLGPGYEQGSLESEASGRSAVRLEPGQHLDFTVPVQANALTVSGNLPDGAEGTVAVFVNGRRLPAPLQVTSRFSYLDTPGITGSTTHHFFDSARMLLGGDLHPGDVVRLQPETAAPYTVDLADFEQVAAPPPQPPGSVSVTGTGADPTGAADASGAFTAAIQQARSAGGQVWIPPGQYRIDSPLPVDGVSLRGAGAWHSVLHSSHLIDQTSSGGAVGLHDFAVLGSVTDRVDDSPDNAVTGSLGPGSAVTGLWLQHLKVGLWLTGDNTDLLVEGNRILDTTADGINLNGSAQRVRVRGNYLRNTGDDALAMWSLHAPDTASSFTGNTVIAPNLANGIAVYGGSDLTVADNLVADTNALGSGIALSNQSFGEPFFPLAGQLTVSGNRLVRAGALNPNWGHAMGALRVDAHDSPITAQVRITDTTALESPHAVFEFVDGGGQGNSTGEVVIDRARIDHAGTFAFQAETAGSARVSNVVADSTGAAGVYNCPSGGAFDLQRGEGDSGWDSTWSQCGTWPQPR